MRHDSRNSLLGIAAFLLWALSIGLGFQQVEKYENTAGRAEGPPLVWPENSKTSLTPGRLNIVLVAHSRCPCTRASLDALQEAVANNGDQVAAHVMFWMPQNASRDWMQTDLWRRAAAIPNLYLHADENGRQARQFGVSTSGHVVVYDGDGKLVFSGGVTSARGRSGNSQGADAIRRLIARETPSQAATPVFGCSLFGSSPECKEESATCQ